MFKSHLTPKLAPVEDQQILPLRLYLHSSDLTTAHLPSEICQQHTVSFLSLVKTPEY